MESRLDYPFAIVTSRERGYASLLMDTARLGGQRCILILNQNTAASPLRKRMKKILRVGPAGALLGVFFRKCYKFEFASCLAIAERHGIPVIRIRDFKPDSTQKEQIKKITLGISMGNGYIPVSFFTLFEHGMINVHHEILPDYAGAQSIVWPLIEGRKETGFSIHQINKGLDKGALLMVRKRAIEFGPSLAKTVAENYYRSLELSVEGLLELLETHPREWSFQPNLSQRSYTTPTFVQWIRAFANHRKFRKSAV